jgi:hypothetical protein
MSANQDERVARLKTPEECEQFAVVRGGWTVSGKSDCYARLTIFGYGEHRRSAC